MAFRRIYFKSPAFKSSSIYQAMVKDGVQSYSYDSQYDVVEIGDNLSDDYPTLRNALRSGKFTYAAYQQKDGQGDHEDWYGSAKGGAEIHLRPVAAPVVYVRNN